MKRMMRIVLLALLLTGCAGEKGIIDRDGPPASWTPVIRRRLPIRE